MKWDTWWHAAGGTANNDPGYLALAALHTSWLVIPSQSQTSAWRFALLVEAIALRGQGAGRYQRYNK